MSASFSTSRVDRWVFFDEPGLHLHPELSHRLIQTLGTIGERNQFVLTTHSPDIIAGSLDKSVIFVSPPSIDPVSGSPMNQAVPISEDDETNRALRMLGHSIGIITLGKKIVLVEGDGSSIDKETYGSLILNKFPGLVLVPSGGKHVIESFGAVHDSVLSKSLWGVEFYMLCDRDSAPYDSSDTQRVKVLPRYHLENYFLDEDVWAEAFSSLEEPDSWLRNPSLIRDTLRNIASEYVSYATALFAASTVRRQAGNVDVMIKGANSMSIEEVKAKLGHSAAAEDARLTKALDLTELHKLAEDYSTKLATALDADDESWKVNIPGKPVLATFANRAGLKIGRARKLYLDAALRLADHTFDDVTEIFEAFASS